MRIQAVVHAVQARVILVTQRWVQHVVSLVIKHLVLQALMTQALVAQPIWILQITLERKLPF